MRFFQIRHAGWIPAARSKNQPRHPPGLFYLRETLDNVYMTVQHCFRSRIRENMADETAITVDGEALSRVRVEAEMSLDDVAREVGCNRSSVSRWERGQRVPSGKIILSLLAIFKTDKFLRYGA